MKSSVRFAVFQRDHFRCVYCGNGSPDAILHVDHVLAKAHGGIDGIENLVTACSECNFGKGTRAVERTALKRIGLEWCSDACPQCPIESVFCLPESGRIEGDTVVLRYRCSRGHDWGTRYRGAFADSHAFNTYQEYRRANGRIKVFPKEPTRYLAV